VPMPHQTQLQVIKRRLIGKEGSARLHELRDILTTLPDYKNGPYADIRKWVSGEIDATRARSRVVQRDSLAVKPEGAAQIALVGAPNTGKSSLLHALSEVQIKIGNYAFTTLRPVPALVRIGGVLVQFVEIPGLIAGASEDRGGGRALLGVLRGADAIVFCQDASASIDALRIVQAEVALAGLDLPYLVAATKMDEAAPDALCGLQAQFPDQKVVPVSILDDDALELFKQEVWALTGLLRVYLRHGNEVAGEPLALPIGATTLDVARSVHNELASRFKAARLWGPSARYEGQQVGKEHQVADGDVVEVMT
jgi:uncharacterized protein